MKLNSKKSLLIEKISINRDSFSKFESSDNKLITEDSNSKKYKCLVILKDVNVSKYTENINGRIYSKELWENVKKLGSYEGTLSLADHPEDDSDGSVKDIVAVWHNLKIGNEFVTCDCYVLDNPNGYTILKTLEAGGQVGLSSVGYGEIDDDGKTVIPESYELVRVGDFVINPSQGVFATLGNVKIPKSENVLHDRKNKILENTNIIDGTEIINKDKYMALENLQIANFKSQIREQIKKGKKAMELKDMASLLESYNDLKEMEDDIPEELNDQKELVNDTLEEMSKVLGETIKSKEKTIKEKHNEIIRVKENYGDTLRKLNSLKVKLESIYKDKKILEQNSNSYESDLKNTLKDITLMESDISNFKSQRRSMKENIKLLIKERRNLLEDNVNLLKYIVKLKEKVKSKVKSNNNSNLVFKLQSENARLKRKIRENEIGLNHTNNSEYDPMDMNRLENQYTPSDIGMAMSPSMDFQADDPNMGLIPDAPAEIMYSEKGKMKKKFIKDELRKYYSEQVKKYPSLKNIQNDILKSNSLIEAVNKVESFKSAGTKLIKQSMKESVNRFGFTDFSKMKAGLL